MSSTKDFRGSVMQELLTWSQAQFPDVPVAWENGPTLDEDNVGPLWIDISLRWSGSEQMPVGNPFVGRVTGTLSVQVFTRQGAGTSKSDDIIDSLSRFMAQRRIGAGVVLFPVRSTPVTALGWYKSGLVFPFWVDITR